MFFQVPCWFIQGTPAHKWLLGLTEDLAEPLQELGGIYLVDEFLGSEKGAPFRYGRFMVDLYVYIYMYTCVYIPTHIRKRLEGNNSVAKSN